MSPGQQIVHKAAIDIWEASFRQKRNILAFMEAWFSTMGSGISLTVARSGGAAGDSAYSAFV